MDKKKNLIKSILFCIGFLVIYQIIGIAVIDTDSSTRLKFHDFYQQDRIDFAVIGASRANNGFVPELADNRLGINTFNLATTSQTFAGSYYVLKELIHRYEVETVFLDVEFCAFSREPDQQKANWIISDYMRGLVKYQYILDVFDSSDWLVMFSRVCRYREEVSAEWCRKNLKAKLCKEYWDYSNDNKEYENYNSYRLKGWCELEKNNEDSDFFVFRSNYGEFDFIKPEDDNDDNLEYLYRFIDLCKKKGIRLVLVTFPETDFYLAHSGDYSIFRNRMTQIAHEYGVEWYDLNLLADERFTDIEFSNLDHLSALGAQHCTNVICDLFLNPSSHSFSDKLSESNYSGIIGVTYDEKKTDEISVLKWDVESYYETEYKFRIMGYDSDTNLIFDSGLINEKQIEMNDRPDVLYIEIYDEKGEYIGKGEFL